MHIVHCSPKQTNLIRLTSDSGGLKLGLYTNFIVLYLVNRFPRYAQLYGMDGIDMLIVF
jgi:hypothetical protein